MSDKLTIKTNDMKAMKKEIVKEYIYINKLFTDKTLSEALKVSLIGLPAISRKEKIEIYKEYKEDESLDKLRLVRHFLFGNNAGVNEETNLFINNH